MLRELMMFFYAWEFMLLLLILILNFRELASYYLGYLELEMALLSLCKPIIAIDFFFSFSQFHVVMRITTIYFITFFAVTLFVFSVRMLAFWHWHVLAAEELSRYQLDSWSSFPSWVCVPGLSILIAVFMCTC